MKLIEHEGTETTLERLPELPHGVDVPDDISGIPHLATPHPTGLVRWTRWLAAVVVIGGLGVVGALLFDVVGTEDAATLDFLEQYGTDNPVIVEQDAVPGSVEVGGGVDFLERYGTDNPVIVEQDAVPGIVDSMEVYGTDNPIFVERTSMERYGTDNPDFAGD